MSDLPRFRWALVWLPVLTISAVVVLLTALANMGSAWRPATCWPDACFCEAIGAGPLRQPINTWSNLAFVIVGWLIAAHATADRPLRRSYALLLAFACVAIGLGSWFYHASLSFVGQWFDVMAMYLLGVFMALYAAARLLREAPRSRRRLLSEAPRSRRRILSEAQRSRRRILSEAPRSRRKPIGDRTFAVGYVIINVALGVLLIVWPEARRFVFGALIVVALLLEAIIHRTPRPAIQARWLIGALAVYVVAQVIWTLDLNHLVCDPTSVLQGHAVWHVLTAISAGLVYRYYQSEVRMIHG